MLPCTAIAMSCDFQQVSVGLWIIATPQGKVIPPAENVFITFRRLSTPFAPCPPSRARLNGDDRMAADPEQSRRPPNSRRSLPRQATSFYVTVIDRSNTSNTITHPVRICHDLSTFGFSCTPSITVMPGIYNRNSYANFVSRADSRNQKSRVPPARSAGGTRLAAGGA